MYSSNIEFQPKLDHVRFLAAMLVFCFHVYHTYFGAGNPLAGQAWAGMLLEGHTGIGLFFVLSGYLFMSIALTGKSIRYWHFMRNRFLRIFPLYVVVFFISISVFRDGFRPYDVLYLFFSNLGLSPLSNSFMTGAAWTISVEFSFYFVFPFIARFAIEQGPAYLVKLILLMLFFKTVGYVVAEKSTHMLYSTLVGRFDQFLIGMLLCQMAAQCKAVAEKRLRGLWAIGSAILLWVALALLARYASYFRPEPKQLAWLFWPTVEAVSWGMFIVSYHGWRGKIPGWLDRLFCRGGELSYSIYLLHAMVLLVLKEPALSLASLVGNIVGCCLYFTVSLGATWLISVLCHQSVEKPFLALRKKYTEPREA